MDQKQRVIDLRKRAALMRAEAHALEEEAAAVEAVINGKTVRDDDRIIVPRAGNLGIV